MGLFSKKKKPVEPEAREDLVIFELTVYRKDPDKEPVNMGMARIEVKVKDYFDNTYSTLLRLEEGLKAVAFQAFYRI